MKMRSRRVGSSFGRIVAYILVSFFGLVRCIAADETATSPGSDCNIEPVGILAQQLDAGAASAVGGKVSDGLQSPAQVPPDWEQVLSKSLDPIVP